MAQGFQLKQDSVKKKKSCCSKVWGSAEIAVNPTDTNGMPVCMLKMCLHKSVYEWRVCLCCVGLYREELCCICARGAKNLLNSNYSTLYSNRHMLPLCSALLLEETSERLLQPLTSLPFFHMNSRPSATAHSASQTSLFLKKIRNKERGNEFYCPIFPSLCLLTKAPHSPPATSALLLLKKRKGKWILQPLVLSVSSDTLTSKWHTPPLSLFLIT